MTSQAYIYPLLDQKGRFKHKRKQQALTSNDIFDDFIFFACDHFKIKYRDFISKKRFKHLVEARQWVCYYYREYCNEYKIYPISLTDMGKRLGDRDHATIIHSIKTMAVTLEWAWVGKRIELSNAYDIYLQINNLNND